MEEHRFHGPVIVSVVLNLERRKFWASLLACNWDLRKLLEQFRSFAWSLEPCYWVDQSKSSGKRCSFRHFHRWLFSIWASGMHTF